MYFVITKFKVITGQFESEFYKDNENIAYLKRQNILFSNELVEKSKK